MARTVVGYIGAGGLNNMASASPTASVEALTGLPINTGLTVGSFHEIGAEQAALYSNNPTGSPYPYGQLYDGVYMWVQLDPTVSTDPIPMGTALAWLGSAEGATGPIQVTTLSASNTDFAGVTIDSNSGKSHPYFFIQCQGKVAIQFDTSNAFAHIGDYVALSTSTYGWATTSGAQNTAATALQLGVSLTTSGTQGTGGRFLIRITRALSRF